MPEVHDEEALRLISMFCPTSILYCPNDHWAPLSHMNELLESQRRNKIPNNIKVMLWCNEIVHGFVVFPKMIPSVVDFVVESMRMMKENNKDDDHHHYRSFQSKL